jgi:uncharacterized protein YegL
MTKENFASINVVIDRSGSMADLAKDTIGSFNTFLTDQKEVPGEAAFTLCTFRTDYNLVHDFVKLASVPDLNAKSYRPAGGTALLDALGTTINSVGQKLAAMPEDERPSKVIFLVITDGEENSSHNFTKAQVKSMIEHQQEAYKWEFVFMGANIDAVSEAQSLGIRGANSMNYFATSAGTQDLYKTVSQCMSSYRIGKSSQVDYFSQTPTVLGTPPAPTVPPTIIMPETPVKK